MWFCWMIASAGAGGYFYADSGIVATGRGGAFVAGADTQFAQYYNPAGLIRIGAPTVNLGVSGVQQNVSFTRARADGTAVDDAFFPTIDNEAAPFAIPQGGFATPIGDRVGFAFGFYSPFAPSSEYDEEGPQRYSIKDTLIYQFSVGPSVAVKLHDTLAIGLGLQWNYLQVGQSLDIVAPGLVDFQNPDSPTAEDIAVDARVVDLFTPSFNAGLLFEPIDELAIGLAVQPPTRFGARGEGSLDFTGSGIETLLAQPIYADDDVGLNLDLPLVLRAGVAVRPRSNIEIEAAVVYQGWRALEEILVDDIDITVEPAEGAEALIPEDQRQVDETISLPTGFRDSVSLRLGGEWRALDELELRAGGFYENGAVPNNSLSVALVDPWKIQLGGGGSAILLDERLWIDASFAALFFPDLEIRDSTVTQVDSGVRSPFAPDAMPAVVGNGNVSSNGWVVGVQARWAFGTPHRGLRSASRDDG